MHVFTDRKPESVGLTGEGLEADGMAERDAMIDQLRKQLDDLKITDNTIVVYTTDNGAESKVAPCTGPSWRRCARCRRRRRIRLRRRLRLLLELVSRPPNRVAALSVRLELVRIKILHRRLVIVLQHVNVGQHQIHLGIFWDQVARTQGIGFRVGCSSQSHLRPSQLEITVPTGVIQTNSLPRQRFGFLIRHPAAR